MEEAKDLEEPPKFVDVDKASDIEPQASYSIVFKRQFSDKYKAKEFLKAAKDLSAVSCESSEDHIYEGTVTQAELKEDKNQFKCYVEVQFSRDSYQNLRNYLKAYDSHWKLKEKKIMFYKMMRENLKSFKETSTHKEVLIQKTAPQKSQKMSPETQELYEIFVEENSDLNNDQKSAIKNVR